MTAKLYFDGSATFGGKPAGWGFVLYLSSGEKHTRSGAVSPLLPQTNNTGEYTALLEGLRYALAQGQRELLIIGDSQLVIYQVSGRYRVKNEALKSLHSLVLKELSQFDSFVLDWRRREENEADEFSRG